MALGFMVMGAVPLTDDILIALGRQKLRRTRRKRASKRRMLKSAPFILGPRERSVVDEAIRQVCQHRSYPLHAINVRTNHAHSVVGNSDTPEHMMNSFKAYSTRALREVGLVGVETKLWSRHGSTRYLWTDEDVAKAVDYVVNGQGEGLPEF